MDELLIFLDAAAREWLELEKPKLSRLERHFLPAIEAAIITDHESLTSHLANKLAAAGVKLPTP